MTRREEAVRFASLPVEERVRLAFGDVAKGPYAGRPPLRVLEPSYLGGADDGNRLLASPYCHVEDCHRRSTATERKRRGKPAGGSRFCGGHVMQLRRGSPLHPVQARP